MNNEKLIFLYILKNNLFKYVKDNYFSGQYLGIIYNIAKSYYEEHGNLPYPFNKTLFFIVKNNPHYLKQFDIQSLNAELITQHLNLLLDNIFDDNLSNYDEYWIETQYKTWLKIKSFESRNTSMISFLASQNELNSDNVDYVINKASEIFNDIRIDLQDKQGVDFFDINNHKFDNVFKIKSGKKFIDNELGGGLLPKTMSIYLGQQGKGKSLWMGNDAAYFVSRGYNVVYVSLEMDEKSLIKRIGSNLFKIPISHYEKYTEKVGYIQNKINQLKMSSINPNGGIGKLHIVQLAGASTKDITSYINNLEKVWGEKNHVVIIDYLKIMTNWRNPSSKTWQDLDAIAQDIREEGIKNDWLMITAMQIGKPAWNMNDYDIEAIAESAAIAHHADLILGIIQDHDMTINNEYWLKILKMRNGGGIGKKCRFEFNQRYLSVTETNQIEM